MTISKFILRRIVVLFATCAVLISASIIYNFNGLIASNIREKSLITADSIKAGLTAHMNSGTMDKRDYFIKEIEHMKGIDKLWIVRVDDLGLGPDGRPERLTKSTFDSVDDSIVKNKTPQFIPFNVNGMVKYRVAVPYIATNVGTLKCLDCHHVRENTVLGILNMEMDVSKFKENNFHFIVLTTAIFLVFVVIAVAMLVMSLNATVARPLNRLMHDFANSIKDYSPISEDGFDVREFKSIAREMNGIIDDIRERDKDIRMLNMHLELTVEERTKQLEIKAITDNLTGLLNRSKLKEDLARYSNVHKAVLLINIDDFSQINNVYGMRVGDMLLKEVAGVLIMLQPRNSYLYRMSGDEFLLMMLEAPARSALEVAQNIKEYASNVPMTIHDEELNIKITFTIGIDSGLDEAVIRRAGVAFIEARENGKNRIQAYSSRSLTEQKYKNNIHWAYELKKAIETDNIVPYFQPIVNNKTGKIEKFEALVRMIDSTGNVVSPVYFLEPARKTGIFTTITKIMIDKTFAYFKDKPYEFSINVTDFDFKEGFLIKYLVEKAEECDIGYNRVVIEILEGISMKGTKDTIEQINELCSLGFRIAIDDFGAEYSNFSRLLQLKTDYIKIDGSFIKGLDKDRNSYNIVKSISEFARSVNTKVIAEFVHSREVQDKVLELDIDYSQGYYFSPPVPDITQICLPIDNPPAGTMGVSAL